jgi:penicillin-insensitive murein endopeptidase
MRKLRWSLVGFALLSAATAFAAGENPWAAFDTPTEGPSRAIGEYSAGCLQGGVPLALDGPGYQIMHPSRKRFYGHPVLLEFIRALGRGVKNHGLSVVLVGDMSQPRGGRAPGGHSSHQSGLDVDVWFWHPKQAKHALLSESERETLSARSILDGKSGGIRSAWKDYSAKILRIAAEDPRVERIFVNPIIKRELCALPPAEGASPEANAASRAYLRKLRPWHGHDDHFHARLTCPAKSPSCKNQAPIPEGDGCAELSWWFDPAQQAAREAAQKEYQHTVVAGRGWPDECEAVLQ